MRSTKLPTAADIMNRSVLTLSPPLTISREDLDRALTIVEEAIVSASDS